MSLTFDGMTAAEPTALPLPRPGGMRFQSSAQAGARPSPVCGDEAVQELKYNRSFTLHFEQDLYMELHPQFTDPEYKMAPGAWDLLAARYNFRVYQRVLQKVPGPVPSLNTAQNLKDFSKKLACQAQEAIAAVHSHRALDVQEQANAPQTRTVSTSPAGAGTGAGRIA